MLFVELLGILQVYLEDIARSSLYLPSRDLFFCRHNTRPPEVSNREGLTHGPAVEIVCIEVENVRRLFFMGRSRGDRGCLPCSSAASP